MFALQLARPLFDCWINPPKKALLDQITSPNFNWFPWPWNRYHDDLMQLWYQLWLLWCFAKSSQDNALHVPVERAWNWFCLRVYGGVGEGSRTGRGSANCCRRKKKRGSSLFGSVWWKEIWVWIVATAWSWAQYDRSCKCSGGFFGVGAGVGLGRGAEFRSI